MKCIHCGCTETQACRGGCYWAAPGVCSACVKKGRARQNERPITFARHLLDDVIEGRKTKTRRLMTHQPVADQEYRSGFYISRKGDKTKRRVSIDAPASLLGGVCPFGAPGELLWVRETTVNVEDHGYQGPVYLASEEGCACLDGGLAPSPDDMTEVEPWELKRRPSIHMPKAMARIWLEITDVRIQRLQDVSEADCIAEGARGGHGAVPGYGYAASPREHFEHVWRSVGGDWHANPWVWAITFRRVHRSRAARRAT